MANPQGSFIWYELMTPDPDGPRPSMTRSSAGTIETAAVARDAAIA